MAENTGLYLTAMVGIVAVVAVVILTMSAGGKQAELSLGDVAIAEDLSGQAYKRGTVTIERVPIKKPLTVARAPIRYNQGSQEEVYEEGTIDGAGPGQYCNTIRCPDGTTLPCFYMQGNIGCQCPACGEEVQPE